jgi:DNA invertase Pin-like site-specific DNA recombinase
MISRKKKILEPTQGWVLYLRTSDKDAQDPEASQNRQRFMSQRVMKSYPDLPFIAEYHDELTGKTPKRKDYQRMLADAKMGKFSMVVVECPDRFGRSDTEALRAIDELHSYGVAVRFANHPELNPVAPDDRIMIALSFALARRESLISGQRIRGAAATKRSEGGYLGRVPDGYISVEDDKPHRKSYAKKGHHIELDPERAKIWRYAWDLLLADRMTLAEICEELHAKGYRYRTGRPFVDVTKVGRDRHNYNTLSDIFKNWTYAGWVESEEKGIPPKTLRGNWEPLVTTEEFEQGLAILERRSKHRVVRRKYDYLLKALIYYEYPDGTLRKLTGSRPNVGRGNGGHPYYCVHSSNINFPCGEIDGQIPHELEKIQVDPDLIPVLHEAYTAELAEQLGLIKPDERAEIEESLKGIKHEEARAARLYASGKITDEVWDGMWQEWEDRRRKLVHTLKSLDAQYDHHVINLEIALQIISKVGILYNRLDRGEKKELLRLMVERVIVNTEGKIRLELRAPFAYLNETHQKVRGGENKNASVTGACSDDGRFVGQYRTRTYDLPHVKGTLCQLS